jgi:hypothetical protein
MYPDPELDLQQSSVIKLEQLPAELTRINRGCTDPPTGGAK